MFLRIPFTLKLQVSMDHESYFMGNLEDRKMKQPYSYYTLRFGAGQGVLAYLTHVAAYCWLTWSGKGDRQQLGSQQLHLLLHPPSASLIWFSTYQVSWQRAVASPAADTYSNKVGGFKVAKDQQHRFQFTLIGPIPVPICSSSPSSLSNCLPWRQTWQPPIGCFTSQLASTIV